MFLASVLYFMHFTCVNLTTTHYLSYAQNGCTTYEAHNMYFHLCSLVSLYMLQCLMLFSLLTELGLLLTMFTAYLIKLMTVLLCLQLNCRTKPQAAPPSLGHGSTSSHSQSNIVLMIHIWWHWVVVYVFLYPKVDCNV